MNPGIEHFVNLLNELQFKTTDSGDGRTHEFECDRAYPYTVVLVTPDTLLKEAVNLLDTLRNLGFYPVPVHPDGQEGLTDKEVEVDPGLCYLGGDNFLAIIDIRFSMNFDVKQHLIDQRQKKMPSNFAEAFDKVFGIIDGN